MAITLLYVGEDGRSHFEEIDPSLSNRKLWEYVREPVFEDPSISRKAVAEAAFDWPDDSLPQCVLILMGHIDIDLGNGVTRRFGRGNSCILLQDQTGIWHVSRAISKRTGPCEVVVLPKKSKGKEEWEQLEKFKQAKRAKQAQKAKQAKQIQQVKKSRT